MAAAAALMPLPLLACTANTSTLAVALSNGSDTSN